MPPAREHPHDAQPRAHVVDAAAALAEVGVADAHEAVLAGRDEHALQQAAGLLLALGALVQLRAGPGELVRQAVAQDLELAEIEHPRRRGAAAREGDIDARAREGRDERLLQCPLEVRDLGTQRPPSGGLVGGDEQTGRGCQLLLEHRDHADRLARLGVRASRLRCRRPPRRRSRAHLAPGRHTGGSPTCAGRPRNPGGPGRRDPPRSPARR